MTPEEALMLDPIPRAPQTEADQASHTLAAIETILLDEPDDYIRMTIRIGMALWDCDRVEAAARLGIERATAYRARESDVRSLGEWLSEGLGERGRDDAAPVTRTALYSYYDADDVLLYVGITDNLHERTYAHVKRSSWMDFAARSTVERFPTREAAEAEEEERIRTLSPLFNSRHNEHPGAPLRLVEYLVKHGRVDLLAPAVSRG